MNADTTVLPRWALVLAASFSNKNQAFLSCCRDVERAIQARRKQIPRELSRLPLATIRPVGRAGPYRLVDDHGGWRQELCFINPLAAELFIQTLRASAP
jgi:hypothetical protein